MTTLVIILVVIAVVLVGALVAMSVSRKKDQQARVRADELRSEAAQTAVHHDEQAARAREAQAEADRARAQADRLEAQAQQEQTSFDQTRAQHEDHLREADRLDPDVDHTASDYRPGADHTTQATDGTHATEATGATGSREVVDSETGEHRTLHADGAHPQDAGYAEADRPGHLGERPAAETTEDGVDHTPGHHRG